MNPDSILNAISIDVEEWYQTTLINRNNLSGREVTNLPNNIHEILLILEKYNTKATFFIVGSVAKQYPGIVKMIAKRGHEVASHGYRHKLVYRMSKQEFIRDISRSLDALRKNTQTDILGYRAPTWSVTSITPWAIDVLQSAGLRYDASMYPFSLNLLKSRRLKKFPYKINDSFVEFPLSTFNLLHCNLPFSGGMFLRIFPFNFIKNKVIEINEKGYPVVVYLHSWEFDNQVPKMNISKWRRLIQYSNLSNMKRKLLGLLQIFKFASLKEVLQL